MAQIANSTLLQTEGIPQIKDALVVLVKTEWNAAIINELENGCLRILHEQGIHTKTIVVPGAVEIPFAIQHYHKEAKKKEKADAFIALGCVIKGDTPHFDYVCQSITQGITQLNVTLDVPSIFGVLTVNTQEQAEERIGGIHGHKGEEAAITALKMIALSRLLKKDK
ncbi:6,7-dimethyl-8-ribityllumazine synthase [Flavisolibacter tropicus]|uniref:6,7-dimethyl-8-ribityllumazine synthase n=1 Tax=Flavisolibacter tropicus TaxID=1492898 RepID=UPI00082D98DB|nr:6,7-dimethyl-8-ribityllumazine synthase [Flavisolibacter tropicus]